MSAPIAIRLMRLPHGEGLPLPVYATAGAAGMDVVSAEDHVLTPGARHAVATGFAIAIPPGYEVQVRPRSGLALKHGITCLNTPGTIDEDYRGEVKVILANLGDQPFTIARGGTLQQVAELIHKDVASNLKHARVWGSQVHDGTSVKGDYVLADRDVVEIHV